MSLQVWLPLNGDIRNQGLDGTTTLYGSPSYYTAGKIGKGMNTAGAHVTGNSPAMNGAKQFTLAFWINAYEDANYSKNWNNGFMVCTKAKDGTDGTFRFESCYSSNFDRACSFHDNPTYAITNASRIIIQNKNEWHHVCVTCDGVKLYTYRDGIKIYTDGANGGSLTGVFTIGSSDSAYKYLGCINDVRIYDHCLSAKEVKEISKGLVLHYPLNNNGLGNPNLVVNSQQLNNLFSTAGTSAWSRSYTKENDVDIWTATCTTAGSGGVHTQLFRKTTDKIGKRYTWSCWIKGSKNFRMNIGSESGGTTVKNITAQWQYIKHTWTFADNTYQSFVWYTNSSPWAVGDWFKVKDLKIEEGEKATPWCPNAADDLYNQWAMNNLIEYDCSGYGHNGNKSEVLKYSTNSIRYQTNSIFSGSQYIAAGREAMVTDAITVSWFGYMDNWSNYSNAISCTEAGGWNFESNDRKMTFPIYRNGAYIHAKDSIALSSLSSGWHHFVGTYDGYKACLFIDGILKGTSSVSDTKYPITYNATNGIFVGAEAGSSISTPASGYFNGLLSDVRIYATALSVEDIKELYQIPISIDKDGNSYASEYVEKESPKFYKSGIIENKEIIETAGINYLQEEFIQKSFSFTPSTGTNSCHNQIIVDYTDYKPGEKIWAKVDVEWSGFDTSNTEGTFNLFFQGAQYSVANNKWEWSGNNYLCGTLNNAASPNRLTGLVLSTPRGKITLVGSFTPTTYPNTYSKSRLGIRSDYSNGTGKIIISNIEIIPDKYYGKENFKLSKEHITANQIYEV